MYLTSEVWIFLSATATLALATAAVWTIRSNNKNREKEKKRGLLSEIANWGVEAHSCVMQVEAPYNVDLTQDETAIRAASYNTFRVLTIAVIRGTYIRTLADKVFREYKLGKDVQAILDNLNVLSYLEGLGGGFSETREIYDKTFRDIVNAEIKAKGADNVRVDHETQLTQFVRALFDKIGDIFNDL